MSKAAPGYEGIFPTLDDFQKMIRKAIVNDDAEKDLMVRLSQDSNKLHKDHRPLVKFAKESCAELTAGGKKAFMKPQCVQKEDGTKAIFFPHLSWTKKPEPRAQAQARREQAQEGPTHQGGMGYPVAEHESITLDQYYYSCLDSTDDRDQDQVLSRNIARRSDPQQEDKKELKSSMTPPTPCNNGAASRKIDPILVVNQVWLWVVDNQTIILSTTYQSEPIEPDLFQHIVRELGARTTDSPVIDTDEVIRLVLSTAADLFRRKEIEAAGLKISALGVFRDSIQIVRDKEARLFGHFQRTIGEKRQRKQDVFGNISQEVELLQQTKDIKDELNILKILARDQESVWRQVSDKPSHDIMRAAATGEIEEMIREAAQVQESVDKLLELKQKQASLVEANIASKHAEEAADQTRLMKYLGGFNALAVCPTMVLAFFTIPLDIFQREGDAVVIKTTALVAAIVVFTICVVEAVCTAYLHGRRPVNSGASEPVPKAESKRKLKAQPTPLTSGETGDEIGDEIV